MPDLKIMRGKDKKKKINEVEFNEEFEEIGALFNQGAVKSLSRLQEIKPTNLSRAMQMGYYTFLEKLRNPENFSIEEIIKLAIFIGTDYNKILEVINKMIQEKYKI
ncbi:hypothetical protein MM239_01950 [Belliella sp. DSM 111904]|uniref:Uncharacterized protein n=1 Tax=Belliella filtrata TaxID=2923435 RepID=A0ABS9UW06_9BACT|nr:hypothetical protein [Belliella filtrata]MCH7408144.1 hypothetical protein [Belliella filtrata]